MVLGDLSERVMTHILRSAALEKQLAHASEGQEQPRGRPTPELCFSLSLGSSVHVRWNTGDTICQNFLFQAPTSCSWPVLKGAKARETCFLPWHDVITETRSASCNHLAKGFRSKVSRNEGQSVLSNGSSASIASWKQAKKWSGVKSNLTGGEDTNSWHFVFFLDIIQGQLSKRLYHSLMVAPLAEPQFPHL